MPLRRPWRHFVKNDERNKRREQEGFFPLSGWPPVGTMDELKDEPGDPVPELADIPDLADIPNEDLEDAKEHAGKHLRAYLIMLEVAANRYRAQGDLAHMVGILRWLAEFTLQIRPDLRYKIPSKKTVRQMPTPGKIQMRDPITDEPLPKTKKQQRWAKRTKEQELLETIHETRLEDDSMTARDLRKVSEYTDEEIAALAGKVKP